MARAHGPALGLSLPTTDRGGVQATCGSETLSMAEEVAEGPSSGTWLPTPHLRLSCCFPIHPTTGRRTDVQSRCPGTWLLALLPLPPQTLCPWHSLVWGVGPKEALNRPAHEWSECLEAPRTSAPSLHVLWRVSEAHRLCHPPGPCNLQGLQHTLQEAQVPWLQLCHPEAWPRLPAVHFETNPVIPPHKNFSLRTSMPLICQPRPLGSTPSCSLHEPCPTSCCSPTQKNHKPQPPVPNPPGMPAVLPCPDPSSTDSTAPPPLLSGSPENPASSYER